MPNRLLHRPAQLCLLAITAAVVGCDDDPTEPLPSATIEEVEVVSGNGPIFRSLHVELDGSAGVEVFYQPIGGGRTFRMLSDADSIHDVLLPRLLADTTYRYAVRYQIDALSDTVARGTFETGPLPDHLSSLDYSVEGTATFPLLFFNHVVDGVFEGVIGMQTDGEIVWFSDAFGTGGAATPIPGSHDILFLSRANQALVRVSPAGEVVDEMPYDAVPGAGVHHDIATLDETRVALIAQEDSTVRDTVVSGEAVWVWDMETDAVEQVWSAWDHFDWDTDRSPRSVPDDWLHANALSVGPRGNLILSLHFLNQVVSIAPDYASLEWRLGGVNATIGVPAEDQFTGQHSAWELPGGRVLLFDNQYEDSGAPSRGLELRIEGDSAHVIWEYVADPPLRSQIWSGIYELDNGHRVVSFPVPGVVQPPEGAPPFTVDEVDAAGQRVWRLTGPGLTATFRGVPWSSIAGEELVAGMP